MTRLRLGLLCLLVLLGVPAPGAHAHARPSRTRWVLTFDDEFRGPALNARRWTASRGPMDSRDDPVQYFLPDDVLVHDGTLTIKSERRSVHGFGYTSGDISTLNKFAQLYGRFVVRARFPDLAGTWSAFYLLPASGAWPPELDVAEYIGCRPDTLFLTNHWGSPDDPQQDHFNDEDPAVDWAQWHVYEVDWEPGVVRWLVDGQVRGKEYEGVATVPMYLRLNTAIGGDFALEPATSGWPQKFQVSYVRVYRRRDLPAPVLGVTEVPTPPPPVPVPASGVGTGTALASAPPSPWSAWDGWMLFLLLVLWGITASAAPGRPRVTAALAVAVGVTACEYLRWRLPLIAWDDWGIALPLFAAELFGILQVLGFQYTVWPRGASPAVPGEDPSWRPLFVLIPTVNEGRDIVGPTVRGALQARDRYLGVYPQGAVTVAICNDGLVAGDPGWQDMERLATELGVVCLTRTVGGGAKAGNLEHARQALGATGEALLVLFDADMVAEPDFLLRTVPPFRDLGLGWVQTGQYYRNLHNPVVRWAHDQQMVFFEALCPGKARLNACFLCGTNAVVRAAALDEIGGLPQDSVTEDFAASLLLHPRWRSLFLPGELATGLGPADLAAYFSQQRRWATGTLEVLFHRWRQILLPSPAGLRPAQRVQYALSGTHYLGGLCHFLFFIAPLLYLLVGVPALRPVTPPDFLRHFGPFWLTAQLAQWYACGRRLRWRGAVLGFGSFPVLLASLLSVLMQRRGRFVVTAKRRRPVASWLFLLPHGLCLLLGLAALASVNGAESGLAGISAFWAASAVLMFGAVFRLALPGGSEGADEAPPATAPPKLSPAEYVARRGGRGQ